MRNTFEAAGKGRVPEINLTKIQTKSKQKDRKTPVSATTPSNKTCKAGKPEAADMQKRA
ncbi:unknown [Bacteroides sp. CAG:633]|uniref:hypothetical protein n=1 Tax=Bacteroides sp. CAG:633 TaxID=1262744 RepID=UPI00033692B1|nr:hypothetical protein [Bacteroides sp. CAG:633]CDB09966.1 unknown [Bacteroides sp. CAG:633]